jgi:hypothetical protein
LAEVVGTSARTDATTTTAHHGTLGAFGRLIRHSFANSGIGTGLGIGIAVVDARGSRDC